MMVPQTVAILKNDQASQQHPGKELHYHGYSTVFIATENGSPMHCPGKGVHRTPSLNGRY